MQNFTPTTQGTFDMQSFVRRYVPFCSNFVTGQRSGRGLWLTCVFASPNVDTHFTIALGHIPTGYIAYGGSVSGQPFNGSNQGSDWTTNSITLRAPAAGTWKLWVS